MRKDYHLHPQVMRLPEQFDAFVQRALQKNIKEICVTDHMPLSLSAAADRIPRGRVADYCSRVRELAKQYEGVISIKCGIELDVHPSVWDEIQRILAEGTFDYTLASAHPHIFITDYPNWTFNDFAAASIENSLWAAEKGLFTAISHFDMYRFPFLNPHRFPLVDDGYDVYRHETAIKAVLDMLVKQNMCMEINPHLAEKHGFPYVYPQEPIMAWALERGVRVTYGSDAHGPASVGALLDELEAHPVYGRAMKQWEETPF